MDYQWIGWFAMKPEVQAAWVQAVGSILAIGVAIFVPAWQLRHQRKDQENASTRRARSLASVLLGSTRTFQKNAEHTEKRVRDFSANVNDGDQFWVGIPNALLDARSELHHLGEPGSHLLRAIYYAEQIGEQADDSGYIWRDKIEETRKALGIVIAETRQALDGMHALLR